MESEYKEDKDWIEKFKDITWSIGVVPHESKSLNFSIQSFTNLLTAKCCFEIAKEYAASLQDNNSAGVFYKINELRDELVKDMPVGKVHAFDLIKIINAHIKKIDNLTDELQSNNSVFDGWISVEERLPGPHIFVLVYVPTRKMAFMATRAYRGLYGEQWESEYKEIFEGITHWQPLPSPPTQNSK